MYNLHTSYNLHNSYNLNKSYTKVNSLKYKKTNDISLQFFVYIKIFCIIFSIYKKWQINVIKNKKKDSKKNHV